MIKPRKITTITAIISLISASLAFTACDKSTTDSSDSSDNSAAISDETRASADEASAPFDPYATENNYDVDRYYLSEHSDVDYGTVLKDVSYYSEVAGDYKECNILLPAGYSESESYPVMYVFHGFNGSHNDLIDDSQYLTVVYGNLLDAGLAVPQIIVNVDMYTDTKDKFEDMSFHDLRYSYDKAVDDVALCLMPFMEENFSIKTGRENTAIGGISEGGAKSLCTGLKWIDKFGYIAAFAPDGNVIQVYEDSIYDSYWTDPYFDELPVPSAENMPIYLYMAVGNADPWNVSATLYYRDVFNENGMKNQTDYVEGYAHNYKFWRVCFYNYLQKVFK